MAFKRSAVRLRLAPPTFAAAKADRRVGQAKADDDPKRCKQPPARAAFAFVQDPHRIAGKREDDP